MMYRKRPEQKPRPATDTPGVVLFSFLRLALYGDRAYTDPRHWRRFKLYLEPFRSVTLVCTTKEERPPSGWLPLPTSVRILSAGEPSVGFGARDLVKIAKIFTRFFMVARRAAMVALIAAVHPIDYAGLLLAVVLRKPILGIRLGSVRDSYRPASGAGVGAALVSQLKSKVGGMAEDLLDRRSAILLVAGQQLRDEIGRGHAFSTSLFDSTSLVPPRQAVRLHNFRWVYAGTLCQQKGTDTLLQALACARRHDDRHTAVLIGPNADHYRVLVRELGIEEAVRFTGPLRWEEVFSVVRECDAFVFPSLHEGMPKAPLEAMSQGLPVVATAAGSANFVVDGLNGLVVRPSEPAELCQKMLCIATDEDLYRRLAAGAFLTASRHTVEVAQAEAHDYLCCALPNMTDRSKHDWIEDQLE